MNIQKEIDEMVGTKKPYSVKLDMNDIKKLDVIAESKGVTRAKLIDLSIKRLLRDMEEK